METKRFDLEDRLVKFACMCLDICDLLPNSKAAQNLVHQLSKSSIASAFVYGEAQFAETPTDFSNKMKMSLKGIQEARIALRIIKEKPIIINKMINSGLKECNELITIFLKSIETQKRIIDLSKLH